MTPYKIEKRYTVPLHEPFPCAAWVRSLVIRGNGFTIDVDALSIWDAHDGWHVDVFAHNVDHLRLSHWKEASFIFDCVVLNASGKLEKWSQIAPLVVVDDKEKKPAGSG